MNNKFKDLNGGSPRMYNIKGGQRAEKQEIIFEKVDKVVDRIEREGLSYGGFIV